ncbi:MAG: hypothetical protein JO257_05625, partial [Deltaproteobacteria bacterium]|nr:hypothetical protein [Deltaproteobacteria bacterium]
MDRLRTLLLARTNTVVMDPDVVADAATRPNRDSDVDKFEDELAQLGYVMSLDLAMTIRRLPFAAMQELRGWIVDTLAKELGAHRPHVPLFRAFPEGVPANTRTLYLKRILAWLCTVPNQPCPWCGEVKSVGALDPCGHLVCRTCWDGGNYAGCPVCHRRVAMGDPFIVPATGALEQRVQRHMGTLSLLHLGFDMIGLARARFERLIARSTPLSPDDRAELHAVIDTIGPRAVEWLPDRIHVKETSAHVVARLWLIAPKREAMVKATLAHLRTATDVLRVACVLMGGNAELVLPMKLGPIPRALRRAVLAALDRLEPEQAIEDVMRHQRLWVRVGERLHPFETVAALPNAALAFAVARQTRLDRASFGPALRERAEKLPYVRIVDDVVRAIAWAGPIEEALRTGNPRGALARLTHRPGELLRRADHLVRVAQARQMDALQTIVKAIQLAVPRAQPALLLTLASHLARRGRTWERRVFFPKGEVLKAWSTHDRRIPLRLDAIGAIVGQVRAELVARAEARRHFPRAVIDRALGDLLVPINERSASRARLAWPRGSELAIPESQSLRLFLHWEEPAGHRVDLDLSVALFDMDWRHVATCDFTNLRTPGAVHSGDLTSAPPPLGASEFVDLDLEALHTNGVRHAVMTVFSYNSVPFDKLTFGFAGLMVAPAAGTHFDPRAVVQRFDLRGKSLITVPLTIDLGARRLRWLDVHVASRGELHQVGGYRAALAHVGKDFEDLLEPAARPTLWDVACIHAAARANTVYIRERDGGFTMYRRRDGESARARLARLMSGADHDGKARVI